MEILVGDKVLVTGPFEAWVGEVSRVTRTQFLVKGPSGGELRFNIRTMRDSVKWFPTTAVFIKTEEGQKAYTNFKEKRRRRKLIDNLVGAEYNKLTTDLLEKLWKDCQSAFNSVE